MKIQLLYLIHLHEVVDLVEVVDEEAHIVEMVGKMVLNSVILEVSELLGQMESFLSILLCTIQIMQVGLVMLIVL